MFAIPKLWDWIKTAAIALVAAVAWAGLAYLKGRGDGKSIASADSLKRDVAARDDQLEMHRDATTIERDMAALSDDEAKRRATEWAKR